LGVHDIRINTIFSTQMLVEFCTCVDVWISHIMWITNLESVVAYVFMSHITVTHRV
jgi:hypothetical protein